jgi:hypothetical protein
MKKKSVSVLLSITLLALVVLKNLLRMKNFFKDG